MGQFGEMSWFEGGNFRVLTCNGSGLARGERVVAYLTPPLFPGMNA